MIIIDFLVLIDFIIPPVQREDWLLEYIKSAFKPLDTLKQQFYIFYEKQKYELTFNGQVIYLEHVLNDQFDNIDRGIYITDATLIQSKYIFTDIENNEETFLYMESEGEPPYNIYTNQEYIDDVDFIVNIPSAVTYDEDLLKFWVNKYRITPMRWKIEIV